jgi:hypothetical protein
METHYIYSQVKVTGSGTQYPSGSALVKIPGVYDGVKWPDIWADNFKTFTIAGPAPAFGGNGGTNNAAPKPPADPSPSIPASSSHSSNSHPTAALSSPVTPSSAATPSKSTSSSQATPTGQCRGRKARRFEQHAARNAKRHY